MVKSKQQATAGEPEDSHTGSMTVIKFGIMAAMATFVVYFLVTKNQFSSALVRPSEVNTIEQRVNRLDPSSPTNGAVDDVDDVDHDDDGISAATRPPLSPTRGIDEYNGIVVNRPRLSSLVKGEAIIGDVEFLLDFAIVGNAKTATTLLSNWLRSQPGIQMHSDEIHALTQHEPANMVKLLYSLPPTGLHGYKAPRDIVDPKVLDLLAEYWPSTKLIVGLRHPILWFQSFYNYRARYNTSLPPAEKLVGECMHEMMPAERKIARYKLGGSDFGLCTDLARFHVHLSLLGKTNVSDPSQDKLLGPRRFRLAKHAPMRNQVYLYESAQLSDLNFTRFKLFKQDLQGYLGLSEPLGPPPRRAGSKLNDKLGRKYPLDICKQKYAALRSRLLRDGIASSTWIQDYFMKHPDVSVSSPSYFRELLYSWKTDPCSQRPKRLH